MTDHLTNALLAAARLDDAEAAKHLGHIVDLDEPHAIAHVTEGRPSLRASMERGGYLHPDHDDVSAIDLLLRAQTEAEPERHYATLARRGFIAVAYVAQRARDALDVERSMSPDASPSKAGHAVALAIRAQSEARPFDTLARIEAMGYPHLADLARRAWAKLPAGSFADDAEEAVGPFPSPAVSSHAATLGARLASPPFAFDDLPPDVARAAGILGGWIDPAAEARRDVAAKARATMAAGDIAGAVGVLVASCDANGSPVEGT